MSTYKHLLVIVLLLIIVPSLEAAPTLTFTYGTDDKAIAGVKVTQTESDGTVTIYASNASGQVTLTTTTNTYTLEASLAETGTDPISVQDALYILQHIVELRTLETDQIKAADINGDGQVTIQDALKVLQHNVELTTINQSLIFLDADTGEALSETTFNPGDTPTITVIKLGDANLSFDPSSITDHAPILTGKTTLTMDENETTVSTLLGTDADGDTLTYEITGGADQDLFSINASTGELSFKAGPDYEDPGDNGGDNLYDVEITVSDGSNTTTQALIISVLDLNEKLGLTNKTIFENEAGATVGELSVNDAEFGNTNITYALSGDDAEYFVLDGTTIKLKSTVSANYEVKSKYTLTVTATNAAGETIIEKMVVKISNVNEAVNLTTALTDQSNDEDAGFSFTVPSGTFIDIDGDALTYSVTLDDGTALPSWLSFDAATQTFSGTPLNDDVGVINVKVTATDGSFSVSDTFALTVVNTNDDPTALSLSATAIDENSSGGVIGDLTTTDVDNIHGDTHTYSLSGDDAASFEIVNDQLKLKDTISANYEVKNSYEVRVTSTDTSGSNLPQIFSITVNDVNDSPVMTSAPSFSANENQTAVDTVTASDEDSDTLIYSLSGTDESSLKINSSSGAITFNSAPNYEVKNSYTVTITVNDGQLSVNQPVTINILDVNDSPVMTSASSFNADENQTAVDTVTASDEDGDTLTYSLFGTDASLFSVNPSSGVITFKSAPDYETKTSYSLTVSVSDSTLNNSQTLLISVNNLNDNIPELTSEPSFSVNENQTGVGIAMATDADGDTLTYELSGTDESSLNINSSSGAITFNSAPNFEVKNSYTINVTASDGLYEASQPITITILDVNDYPVMTSSASLSASENQTAVDTVTATDEDGNSVTYSLSGTDSGSLIIDNTSGVVTFVSAPDYETKMSYSVNVNINDGMNTTNAPTTINVTNVNEIHTLALSSESVDENDKGAVVGVISSPDPDIYSNSTYSYEIVGGSDYFFINSSNNLRLKPSTTFNYEDKDSYVLTIRSSDEDFVVEKEFTIAVNNANEAPYATGSTNFNAWASLNQFFNLPFVDPEGDSMSLEIIGGTDSEFFLIDNNLLKFSKIPNAGTYDDSNGDGTYQVRVKASDQDSLSSSSYFYIKVQKNIAASHTFDVDDLDGESGSFIQSSSRAGPSDFNGDGLDDLFMSTGLIYGNTVKLPAFVEHPGGDSGIDHINFNGTTIKGCHPGEDGDPNWWDGTNVIGTFIANIDGDHKMDVLTEKVDWSNPSPQFVKVVMSDEICSGYPNNNPSRGGNFQIPDNSQGQRISSIYDIGDLNGDGLDDVFFDDFTGESIISLGGTLETFTITYPGYDTKESNEQIEGGYIIGDINGDGYEDIFINFLTEIYEASTPYTTILIFGRENWENIDLSVNDSSSHIKISIPDLADRSYFPSVGAFGEDLNADGIQDFSLFQYVIFGRKEWPPVLDLNTLDGSDGFKVVDPTQTWRHKVDFAGDVNADGVQDLIVLANSRGSVKRSRLIFGKESYEATFDARVRFDSVTRGVEFEGCARGRPDMGFPKDKTGGFDFNGDGFEDLLLARGNGYSTCANDYASSMFLINGGDLSGKVNFIGSETNDNFEGSVSDEIFVTGRGNDHIKTNNGLDVVYAGPGDDIIEIKNMNFKYIDAGYGTDTIKATTAFDINLTTLLNGHKLARIEKIDADNGLENIISIGVPNIISLTEDSMSLTIEGDATDFLELSSDFEKDNSYTGDNDKYTSSKAYMELYVSKDITIL